MSTELTGVEAKMEELILTYGRKIREVGYHRHLAKERDDTSDELYESLIRAKALNQGTTRDTDASFKRPEGGSNNLERVALPKSGGKPEGWPDFHRGFKAILGACIPAIEMARLRHALPQTASKFILGVSEPTEACALDRNKMSQTVRNNWNQLDYFPLTQNIEFL